MKRLAFQIIPPCVCVECGCSEERACPGGCQWVDQSHTICSACVAPFLLDSFTEAIHLLRSVQTLRFLQILAVVLRTNGFPGELISAVERRASNFHPAQRRDWQGYRRTLAA